MNPPAANAKKIKAGRSSEEKEKEVLDVIALNFCNANIPNGVVMVCRLPGARHIDRFSEEFEWVLSMAGQRPFMLEINSSHDFTPPEDSETLLNMVYKNSRGWFPTASHYALAPTEIQMLKADLATIREQFDNIFITTPDGVRHGGSLPTCST